MLRAIGHIRGIVHPRQEPEESFQKASREKRTSYQPIYTRTERSTPFLAALAKSVTKHLGFKDRFEKAIAPMMNANTVGEMKTYFQNLNRVVELSHEKPKVAQKILSKATQSPKSLYAGLTLLACGAKDSLETTKTAVVHIKGNFSLVLDGIRRLASHDPDSAHSLLKSLFENRHLTSEKRLALFREVMMSKDFDKEVLPKSFEGMMEGTTPGDRNKIIYPSMLGLLEKWKPHHPKLKVNQEVTKEMLRGWISSCEIITDANHAHARHVLDIPRSARG